MVIITLNARFDLLGISASNKRYLDLMYDIQIAFSIRWMIDSKLTEIYTLTDASIKSSIDLICRIYFKFITLRVKNQL